MWLFVICRDSVRDPIPQKNEVLVEQSFVFGNVSVDRLFACLKSEESCNEQHLPVVFSL